MLTTTAACLSTELPLHKDHLETEIRGVNMNSQNEQPQQLSQQPIEGSEVTYSLVPRNRNPLVHPGQTMEIEIFLSGYGMPEKNKLFIQWSSPSVINQNRPGELVSSIKCALDPTTGEMLVITGEKGLETFKLDPVGVVGCINKGHFLVAQREYSEFCLGHVASEYAPKPLQAPLLLRLNIDKDAPAGNYEVVFIFTYGNEHELVQDYKSVPFHITSRWERNQAILYGAAVIIAALTLLITAIWYFTH